MPCLRGHREEEAHPADAKRSTDRSLLSVKGLQECHLALIIFPASTSQSKRWYCRVAEALSLCQRREQRQVLALEISPLGLTVLGIEIEEDIFLAVLAQAEKEPLSKF